ncbi:N-acetyl-1-D-myo-inositol-2-amino-2-deoxy-alpha-D-glucopyranoside deacetylase [Jatrophihabitans telluris]|uniref:1D-myo-inositol 2-acetamido-2-deoxy-alpha-D-glucopyranoside deacetylase n=1 Tax=Jatrophihabitans telluris TaxID=2038343 RepID=A0ABY4QW46_9ACTN|nr:N-acetyl-1-D-myo-inositol-2-amino-2-deoxy-alpha-D-glucopyranoside deacetylase [Jatrophihabitans telluris]UQX87715.1 N-acetyl-1-D-myo-inositol-2-amino-2-deoxy-alpha-D-glucopyranoside deacetylase [Jatrophihabitans telluris]
MTAARIDSARRLLLVHAHPDDETIGTGATMAHYAAEGAHVTLVTCTLGEEGEILVPELAQLGADQADQLGGWRIGELTAAMAALGVTDHRFLGGAGRFRDSGMMGAHANAHPRAFWGADADRALFYDAVLALVEIIREVRPQVLVSYDDLGGYGHPDHIMAHRVATAAVTAAAQPGYQSAGGQPWPVAKLYWTATPRSVLSSGHAALRSAVEAEPDFPFRLADSVDELPYLTADELVTTAIHADQHAPAKAAALAAHATQVSVHASFYALSNNLGQPIEGTEYYRLVLGEPGGALDAEGREVDLFGGLEL